uniref:hypothetical protein n=1 Tax=Analipus japonicus TaxID=31333 RepID=UPI002E796AD6|nr:hypothetical protein V2471_pgp011 [Analipus japonicus]WAM61986.1 hypothetical protein [Analipus japonicus]
MNHALLVVKVVQNPIHFVYDEYQTIELKVEFPVPRQKNSKNELTVVLWGGYRDDFLKYYKVQDYLIVEGIITIKSHKNEENEIKIVGKKLYPFILN